MFLVKKGHGQHTFGSGSLEVIADLISHVHTIVWNFQTLVQNIYLPIYKIWSFYEHWNPFQCRCVSKRTMTPPHTLF